MGAAVGFEARWTDAAAIIDRYRALMACERAKDKSVAP